MASTESPPSGPAPEPERRVPSWVKMAAVFLMLAGFVAFLLTDESASSAVAYSTLVDQVVDTPEKFEGRELRVEGELKQGSIKFREEPCEWRFVLEKGGREMPVQFPQCVVPDTFRDGFGISVTVKGQLEENGTFLANQVVPRCPSKYEMKEKLEDGEEMPHEAPGEYDMPIEASATPAAADPS